MRKLSAHFCLLPDGSVGKWPVISMNGEGVITGVRVNNDQFREEPGLEYYGGVLVPGFIEDMRDVSFDGIKEENIMKLMNRFYSDGSLKFICRSDQKHFSPGFKGEVFYDGAHICSEMQPFSGISFWERAKSEAKSKCGGDILKAIYSIQENIVGSLPDELRWGRIEEGSSPGILLIKGLNLTDMSLTEKSSIKILQL